MPIAIRYAAAAFFTSLLLAGCATIGPQKTEGLDDEAVPMNTKQLRVETDLSADEAYTRVARMLQARGYAMENTDSDLGSLTTDYRTIRKGGWKYETRISASIVRENPTVMQFQGRVTEDTFGESDIRKDGVNGSIPRRAWTELYTVASELGEPVAQPND
jgi:outer membrane murein-binding lipoprotein Lpp